MSFVTVLFGSLASLSFRLLYLFRVRLHKHASNQSQEGAGDSIWDAHFLHALPKTVVDAHSHAKWDATLSKNEIYTYTCFTRKYIYTNVEIYIYIYIYRFQNVLLRCPTPRLHCFLFSPCPSLRFLPFMAFLIPSIQIRTWISTK
jgi:hypothetical protein